MSYDGVHLVAIRDGTLQFLVLTNDNTLGSNQLNLVHDTHDELLLIKRLSQEVISTHLETFHEVAGIVEGSQENNGNFLRLRIFFQNHCSIKAIQVGHHDVKQYQVRMLWFSHLYTHVTIGSSTHLKLLIGK